VKYGIAVAMIALIFASCETEPETIPDDLGPAEMFQRAQDAVDESRWDLARRYYEEFIVRYPDLRGQIVEAEYEIAFITYKEERYEESRDLFEAILAEYEADNSGQLPDWPRILSERLIEIIDEAMVEEGLIELPVGNDESE
jgi:outer membrane protein assembly factor BamD (BamD/ComL family)